MNPHRRIWGDLLKCVMAFSNGANMNRPKRMMCDVDLDWCTYTCPCGSELCTRHSSMSEVQQWLLKHEPHTSGEVVEHTTDRGNSVFASPQPDQIRSIM